MRVWAEEVCRNNDWVAGLGGDPQEHQHQPVGIEFPDLPGADCVHKFHDGAVLRLFAHLEIVRAAGEAAADRDPLRDAGSRADPGRHRPRKSSACGPQRGGRPINVKARKAVVLTCGGFENNQEMIRNYLPGVPYCYTSGTPYNEGDGITHGACRSAPISGT